jgi:uncharacterized RDD family membrane protein YckC
MSTETESTPAIPPAPPARYATFTSRLRAFVIDTVCLWVPFLALFFLGETTSGVPGTTLVTWLLMFAWLLLYDPVMVSRRGATVGHAVAHLRVVDARTGRPPSFGRAFARGLIKLMLGVLSFFTMELTRRHQAVHDMVTHTTVQVAESEELVEFHADQAEDPDVVLPSRLRRLVVIAAYLVVLYCVFVAYVVLLDATGCIRRAAIEGALSTRNCNPGREALIEVTTWVWLALSVTMIIAGWKGLLLGARRSKRVSVDVAVA